jgi:predicted nuclease of predicted toxin-antitoxin system
VIDLGMDEASDLEIAAVALKQRAIIITKDGDFGALSALELCEAPIIWIRLGNCRKTALFNAIASSIDSIVERLNAGDMLIELYD